MNTIKDFSQTKEFPGENGNRLDLILHKFENIEKIPFFIYILGLLLLASVFTLFRLELVIILFTFYISDWIILTLLPRFGKSYGPPKPTVFLLAIPRSICMLLPVWFSLPIQFIGTLLVIYGFWVEPHKIYVTYQTINTTKFRTGMSLRVLHLGDLHVERLTKREEQLIKYIDDLQPDIILFSGDILNLSYLKDQQAWIDARAIISKWHAPLGIYFVKGSPAVDLHEIYPELIKNLPIQWLNNQKVTIQKEQNTIEIIGINCTHRPFIDAPIMSEFQPHEAGDFTILLYHSPDLAPLAAQHGIDLQLSGHTHGGQVRIPGYGALITGSLYGKRYESGRYQINDMTLYVTRGIGLEGAGAPRVRFFCKPEIILWEISGDQAAGNKMV